MDFRNLKPLTEAQYTHDLRQLYKNMGFQSSLVILAEMIKGAEIFTEIIREERLKEIQNGENKQ